MKTVVVQIFIVKSLSFMKCINIKLHVKKEIKGTRGWTQITLLSL